MKGLSVSILVMRNYGHRVKGRDSGGNNLFEGNWSCPGHCFLLLLENLPFSFLFNAWTILRLLFSILHYNFLPY